MIVPRPSVERFVKAAVRAERARSGAGADFDVAQRIMIRIHQELGRLIGSAGLDVLFARALVLARRTHPSLARITTGPGGTLAGLDDAGQQQEEAATAIVSHFIELLVTLVGEDLAMRLVRDLWPAADEEEAKK